ncbi:hypothetical protein CYY_006870 [Polysphondylium violaceum]|uniref:TH1 family protein n=1 Tax=Polysphondylium violaceum TaxID=133409 RepID=A0A8J4PSR1_9MYCE|nr:hypothetical protein CYY_006870 [Polysphondylium violaceum]
MSTSPSLSPRQSPRRSPFESGQPTSGTPLSPTEQVKEQCESQLQIPDSIMSINVPSLMKEYIDVGGQPRDVIKFLSESYKGYAQMCNLICHWLRLSGLPDQEVMDSFANHLKDIIMKKFDPKVADTIFSSSPPLWLDEMIADAQWRSLIYQLSEEHKNCLMLNFAIQRISDAGYQNEIASLSTASTYFSVFNKVLLDSLSHLITLDEITITNSIDEFKKVCCQNQHTYLYAQACIQQLMKTNPKASALKRISQELELETVKKSKASQKITLMMSGISKYPAIMPPITSLLMSNTTTTGDIIKLYNEYTKADPPPVEFLRYPSFLDLLISDLFTPGKVIHAQHKGKWIYLVAYSVSVGNDGKKDHLDETIKSIEKIINICQSNPVGSELQNVVPILKENLDLPIISMGVMQWIKFNLTDSTNISSYNTLCVPIYLDFLRDICQRHPLHRSVILKVLVAHFEIEAQDLDSLSALEMRKTVIDNIVYLFGSGYVLPVLDVIESWTPKIDPSLTRYFTNQVLDIVEPPYSEIFMEKMEKIIKIITNNGSNEIKQEVVSNFLEYCKSNSTKNNNNSNDHSSENSENHNNNNNNSENNNNNNNYSSVSKNNGNITVKIVTRTTNKNNGSFNNGSSVS